MSSYDNLPAPRERDLGNGIVALDNAYSLFFRSEHLGTEYVEAHEWCTPSDPTSQPFATGHMLYVCPDCGEIWARKVLRAFPLWEPRGWIIEVAPCGGAMLTLRDEALRQPAVLQQVLNAYLRIFDSTAKPTCVGGSYG